VNCDELVELVTAFLDGAMDVETEQRFMDHLSRCSGCDAYLAQFRRTISTLGELPEDSLSAEARNDLLAAFRGWQR
jgi:anti-sigma factor RsiW